MSVNVVSEIYCRRTANCRMCCRRRRDNRYIKLVAKSKDVRLYSTDTDIN
jgi:recombinational DNA repair protein RecR